MEDFGKSVKTSRRSRNRNYVPTTVINPAANVLSAIEYVEGAFEDRREKVNLFQQQAEQRRIDMQDLVDDTKRVDQTDAQAKMTEQFSNMVTDIYKADIASFGGDRTDYLNKSNNAQKIISSFPKVIGVVDELSNKIRNMNPAEQKKAILRDQFMGKNGDKQMEYLEFLMDPSKMNLRIQGKDIIITNNGKDLFNGTQLLNSVKEGNSLVKIADDYEKEIGAASKDAMTGVKSLIVAKEYETMSKDGTRLSDTQLNDYMGAVNQYKDNLINSGKIDALINESTFQRYTDSPDVYDEKKYGQQTKDAIIDYLVGKEFPMYKKEVDKKGETIESAIGDESIKTKIVTPKATKSSSGSSDSSYIPDVDNIIKGISDLKNDTEKGKTYFIGKKIKGREIKSVKVDGNVATFITRSMTQGGKVVEKEENYNLNNSNSINNLEDDLIKTIIGGGRDAQKARDYAHRSTSQLLSGEEDFSIPEQVESLTIGQWKASEEDLVGGEDKDDEDYEKGTLYQLYPGFKFEQSGFGTNRIIAKTKDGKNKTKELTPGKEDDLKILLDFVEKHSNNDKTDSSAKAKALIDKYKK